AARGRTREAINTYLIPELANGAATLRSRRETPGFVASRHGNALSIQCDAMTKHKVTLIPGEGIGPEVAAATRRILEATGVQIEWEEIAGRSDNSSDQGKTVNQAAEESVRRKRVALKSPMATAIAGGS